MGNEEEMEFGNVVEGMRVVRFDLQHESDASISSQI